MLVLDCLLTVAECANALNVSESTIYALLRTGELQGARIHRMWRIPASNLVAYYNHVMGPEFQVPPDGQEAN